MTDQFGRESECYTPEEAAELERIDAWAYSEEAPTEPGCRKPGCAECGDPAS